MPSFNSEKYIGKIIESYMLEIFKKNIYYTTEGYIMKEKVSIITPSFNSEKYIGKTIESVQKQTYQNWEMIIVDDCSSDRTCNIVEEFSKIDPRVKLIRQTKNKGAGKARTYALEKSIGRFIAYLDADDIWKPDKLEKQVDFMKKHNYGFSCSSCSASSGNRQR